MQGEGRFSEGQLAVLAERVDTLIQLHSETKAALVTLSGVLAQFPVLQERIQIIDGKADRLFAITDRSTERLSALESDVRQHAGWWRWAKWCAPFCVAFCVWGYKEMRVFQETDNSLSGRLTLMEFVLNSKPSAPIMPPGILEKNR